MGVVCDFGGLCKTHILILKNEVNSIFALNFINFFIHNFFFVNCYLKIFCFGSNKPNFNRNHYQNNFVCVKFYIIINFQKIFRSQLTNNKST